MRQCGDQSSCLVKAVASSLEDCGDADEGDVGKMHPRPLREMSCEHAAERAVEQNRHLMQRLDESVTELYLQVMQCRISAMRELSPDDIESA
jgi:hypothetical protein